MALLGILNWSSQDGVISFDEFELAFGAYALTSQSDCA
jgi:hypothetical protein